LKVREETVSTTISTVLDDLGIPNVSLLQVVKVPDIYMVVAGVRVILEVKQEGQQADLDKQLRGRLKANMCDVAVGLEYPASVSAGSLASLTTPEIRKRLEAAGLIALGLAHGPSEARTLFERIPVRLGELPELLGRAASDGMSTDELEKAIELVRDSVQGVARDLARLPDAVAISQRIRKVLDIGE
jgi:hypothetical protein